MIYLPIYGIFIFLYSRLFDVLLIANEDLCGFVDTHVSVKYWRWRIFVYQVWCWYL